MKEPKKQRLTPKNRKFIAEYMVDLNGTQAAIRAGYSKSSAQSTSTEILSNPLVQAEIARLCDERDKRTLVTADYVILGLREVAERCLQRAPVMVFDKAEREMVQAVDAEGRDVWEFDSTGANRALELLGKYMKLFTEKVEHSGKDGAPLVFEVVNYLPPSERK